MGGKCETQLKCLICATQNSNFLLNHSSEKLMEKHLKIIFLLRNVLNISSDKLVIFLEDCPNVEEWISICDNCDKLVNQCKDLYAQLLEVTRKFDKGKERVVKIVRESWSTTGNKDENDKEGALDIFKEVRKDINERKQDRSEGVNRFGDLRAEELAEKIIRDQPSLDDKTVIGEEPEDHIIKKESENNVVQDGPEFEPTSTKWTDNENDIEEDKPEVKDILKIEQESSGKDEDSSKPKEIRSRPHFKCPFCKIHSVILYKSPAQVTKHFESCKLQSKSSITEITCSTCNQFKCSADSLFQYFHHVLTCRTQGSEVISEGVPFHLRVFQCNLCPPSGKSSEFFTIPKFLSHITHHKEFIYKCAQCNAPLKNSLESEKHWKKHHPIEYLDIPEDQRSSQKCHVTTPPTLPSVPWWCPQCGHEFSTEDLRDLHVSTNHPTISKEHPCQLCDKRYHCPKELQLHQVICHSPKATNDPSTSFFKSRKKLHTCSLCPEVFTGKEDFLTHQTRVHKICHFKCDLCQKEFLCDATLRNHRLTHQIDLKCPYCGNSYSTKQSFNRHVSVVHEKTKSFICDHCGMNLIDKNGLYRHQRDKHGLSEKKWKCEVEGCGKRLKNVPDFKEHMARHSKCPEFKCSMCGKEFYTKKNLIRHEKTVHSTTSDEDFLCDECPYRTKYKNNLVTHYKTYHNPNKICKVVKNMKKYCWTSGQNS